jgi:hypothetical protein
VKRRLNVAISEASSCSRVTPIRRCLLCFIYADAGKTEPSERKGDPCLLRFIDTDTEAFTGHGRVHIGAVLLARGMYSC